MRRSVSACVLLVLITVVTTTAALDAQRSSKSCAPAPPDTLRTLMGTTIYVEGPRSADLRHGTLLVGNMAVHVRESGKVASGGERSSGLFHAGALVEPNGRAHLLPLPPGHGEMAWPEIVSLDSTRAMVVWSPRDTTASDPSQEKPTGVLAATTDGFRWGPVERVTIADSLVAWIRWSAAHVSEPVVHRGQAQFLITMFAAPTLWLRRSASGWTVEPLSLGAERYPRMVSNGDTLTVAYVASRAPHGNALFVRRIGPRGQLLGPPTHVSEDSAGAVHHPILRSAGRKMLLVWLVRPPTGTKTHLAIATSTDGGRSWHRGPALPAESADAIRAVADERGRLHVLARWGPGATLELLYALYDGTRWRRFEPVVSARSMAMGLPAFVRGRGGRIAAVWGSELEDQQNRPPVQLRFMPDTECSAK